MCSDAQMLGDINSDHLPERHVRQWSIVQKEFAVGGPVCVGRSGPHCQFIQSFMYTSNTQHGHEHERDHDYEHDWF